MEKIILYSDLNYTRVADYVECNNCGRKMLLPVGADKCPECGSVGCLEWADTVFEESQEVVVDDFIEENFNDIEFKSDILLPKESYLSEETLDEIKNN